MTSRLGFALLPSEVEPDVIASTPVVSQCGVSVSLGWSDSRRGLRLPPPQQSPVRARPTRNLSIRSGSSGAMPRTSEVK
jgi:hypothetical protein